MITFYRGNISRPETLTAKWGTAVGGPQEQPWRDIPNLPSPKSTPYGPLYWFREATPSQGGPGTNEVTTQWLPGPKKCHTMS